MRTHAQAVVIGGGVVGCSILYHLARAGWHRRRAAGTFRADFGLDMACRRQHPRAARRPPTFRACSITRCSLYRDAGAGDGAESCGIFQPGVAVSCPDRGPRARQLRLQEAKARRYGMNFHELDPRRGRKRCTRWSISTSVRCIMFEPDGGNVDPSGVTNAYALGARQMGAEIHRFCAGQRAPSRSPTAPGSCAPRQGRHPHALGRQRRRPLGPRGGRAWRASTCRSSTNRTPVFRHRDDGRGSPRSTAACHRSPTATANIYLRQEGQGAAGRRLRERRAPLGARMAHRRASATNCSPTIWSGSRRT